jgi:hypothetical protein
MSLCRQICVGRDGLTITQCCRQLCVSCKANCGGRDDGPVQDRRGAAPPPARGAPACRADRRMRLDGGGRADRQHDLVLAQPKDCPTRVRSRRPAIRAAFARHASDQRWATGSRGGAADPRPHGSPGQRHRRCRRDGPGAGADLCFASASRAFPDAACGANGGAISQCEDRTSCRGRAAGRARAHRRKRRFRPDPDRSAPSRDRDRRRARQPHRRDRQPGPFR